MHCLLPYLLQILLINHVLACSLRILVIHNISSASAKQSVLIFVVTLITSKDNKHIF